MRATGHGSLVSAIDLTGPELVSVVGGGGKTGAVTLLGLELALRGSRVIATTTTAMFERELAAIGPVVIDTDLGCLAKRLATALREGGAVTVAYGHGREGKVMGLPVELVDELWADGLADHLLVEADGSRGRSLKAWAPHEPQVAQATTTILHVAGLDALNVPLSESNVQRAALLAAALDVPLGSLVTKGLFVRALREQLRCLHQRWPEARVVVLLNKAETSADHEAGMEIGAELVAPASSVSVEPIADAVVVGSERRRRFVRLAA